MDLERKGCEIQNGGLEGAFMSNLPQSTAKVEEKSLFLKVPRILLYKTDANFHGKKKLLFHSAKQGVIYSQSHIAYGKERKIGKKKKVQPTWAVELPIST